MFCELGIELVALGKQRPSGRRGRSRSWGVAGHTTIREDLADEIQRTGAAQAAVVGLLGETGVISGSRFAEACIAILEGGGGAVACGGISLGTAGQKVTT